MARDGAIRGTQEERGNSVHGAPSDLQSNSSTTVAGTFVAYEVPPIKDRQFGRSNLYPQDNGAEGDPA